MRINIRYFAQTADKAGCREEVVDVDDGSQQALKDRLTELHPALGPVLAYCRLAVNGEYIQQCDLIEDNSEVAIIPPVSGG